MLRLFIDEDVPEAVALALRLRGYDGMMETILDADDADSSDEGVRRESGRA